MMKAMRKLARSKQDEKGQILHMVGLKSRAGNFHMGV